jgi:group I intron endonuclease
MSIAPKNGDIPTASGIYKITCLVSKRIYIGSANNLYDRKRSHFNALRRNEHGNPYLQRAWNKYGEQAFTFEVLELVLPISLTAREQYWLNKLKPFGRKGFNILLEAGSRQGMKNSPEHNEKIRQANLGKKQTPEHIEKNRLARLGKKLPPERTKKNRLANLGRKQTSEHVEKRIAPLRGRKQTPEAIEKNRQGHVGKKHMPETIAKIKGRKHTSEELEKMRLASIGRKHTPETIEKMQQAALRRPRKIS